MNNLWEDYKAEFNKTNNSLVQFILVNISVFVVLSIIWLFSKSTEALISSYLHLPSNLEELLFKPWTLITYAFLHAGVGHIFWNMLGLYWFGRIIADLLGHSKLISLYFLGAFAGALAFVVIYNVNPDFIGVNHYLVGASGAIYAISVGAATIAPDYRFNLLFIGPIKISYIVAAYVFFSLLGTQGGNAGGNYAHLGGAAMGYIYIKQLQNGRDLGKYVFAIIDFFQGFFKKKSKLTVTHKNKSSFTKSATSSTTANNSVNQAEIDAILDKISRSGYESLSKDEKQKLFSASQKK